jgi:hypothetical protein
MTTNKQLIDNLIEQAWNVVMELRAADMEFGAATPKELSGTYVALEKLEKALSELKKAQ